MQHHKYSLTEIENMIPWEKEIYVTLLMKYLEEENEKIKQLQQKQRRWKMASGRLAVILEQEYESKGFVSGTISALQKRRKEKTKVICQGSSNAERGEGETEWRKALHGSCLDAAQRHWY